MTMSNVTSLTYSTPVTHPTEMAACFAADCWQQGFERAALPESLPDGNRADKVQLMEAAIAQSLGQVLHQFESQTSPFTWENRLPLALWPMAGYSAGNPGLRASVQTYYRTLAHRFLTTPLPLPTPFLQGRTYREFCFHAWVGRALMEGLGLDETIAP